MAKRRGNIKEIAKICGVSTATVSRVINNKPDVSEASREAILATIRELDYKPKLTVNPTNIIGLTVEYGNVFSSNYITQLVNAIEDGAYAQDYDIMILRNEHMRTVDEHHGQFLKRRMVSGLVTLLSRADDTYPQHLAEEHYPHIVISNPCGGQANSIGTDAYQGMRDAMDYLIELGHQHIGFLHGSMDYHDHRERKRGFFDALEEAGLSTKEAYASEIGGYDPSELGYQTAYSFLKRYPQTTAILAHGESVMGVLECFRSLGLEVPRDISLIAFDDEPWMKFTNPSVTVVVQDLNEIGSRAVRDVIRQINQGEKAHINSTVLPAKLIIRQSTAPVREG